MATKSWTVETDGKPHEVELEWGYWGGRRKVSLDGKTVDESTVLLRWKSTQKFDIDGHECVVRTKPSAPFSGFFIVELELDGNHVPSKDGRDTWESKKSV